MLILAPIAVINFLVIEMTDFLDSLFISDELFNVFKSSYNTLDLNTLDNNIKQLVDNLNHIPGLVTLYSCSGLDRDHPCRYKSEDGYILFAVKATDKIGFNKLADKILDSHLHIELSRPIIANTGTRYGAWYLSIKGDYDIIKLNRIVSEITGKQYRISLRHNLLIYLSELGNQLSDEDIHNYFGHIKVYYFLGEEICGANHGELMEILRNCKLAVKDLKKQNNNISEKGEQIIRKALRNMEDRHSANFKG